MTRLAKSTPIRGRRQIACALAALALTGCTVGPDYRKPDAKVPVAFKENGGWKLAHPVDAMPRGAWWTVFKQPALDALVAQVDISNQNIALAEAQLRQARAQAAVARAAWFPTLDGNLGVTRSKSASIGNQSLVFFPTANTTQQASLAASWEPDLWGRVRRTVEAASATAQATAADLEAARLAAQAQLVQDWFLLRIADRQVQLLQETVAAYERNVQLTISRYKGGVAAKSDVVQAQTQLQQTMAQKIDAGVQRAQLEHAIALLIGKAPSDLTIPADPTPVTLPDIPAGVPSTLLERRPDVAGAERRAAAANAQIGVAEAAFYPSLTLTASGGFESSTLSTLFNSPSRFWSFGTALAQSLFDAGLRKAQKDVALASYDATVAQYRQTVLTSFQEVEDNLASLRILEQEALVQDDAVKSASESLRLTENQYKAGTLGYLNVITAETVALSNQLTAVGIEGRRATATVLLIKALGGWW